MSIVNAIVNGVNFNVNVDMKYAKPKVNDGRKSIKIYNKENKMLYLQAPLMLTWGVNEFQEKDKDGVVVEGGRLSYDMALQFPSSDYMSPQVAKFLQNMKDFEEKVKQDAFANCKEWLGLPNSIKQVTDAFFTPVLKYPKDKVTQEVDYERSPTMKIKIPYWDGFKGFEIYDDKQNQLFPSNTVDSPVELIVKGCQVATILQCGGIWVGNKTYGVTWKLFQAVVKPRESLAGKCHILLTADEKETLENSKDTEDDEEEVKPMQVVKTVEEKAQVVDSDDEDAPKEEVVDVPEPEEEKKVEVEDKPKPKKVVKKKAAVK